jgi:hypothetical protein
LLSEREESFYVWLCARESAGTITPSQQLLLEELDRAASGAQPDDIVMQYLHEFLG